MPELPEVETVVRGLRAPLIGQTIIGVKNDWPRHIDRPDLPEFEARISGRSIEAINRRLEVMDSTAISLCMDNNLPILVLNLWSRDSLRAALWGDKVGTLVNGTSGE